ncbi:MAG TPA: FtsX-like permease family protein [Anaerolineales bacterium]|nr:FtsX-like permease family protein [Anaerolineales bacterium]
MSTPSLPLLHVESLSKTYGSGAASVTALEDVTLAVAGTAFGLLAGLYLGRAIVLGMDAAGFPFPYHFPLAGMLMAIAVGLLFGALAAWIPARHAARLDIVTALHYE